MNQTPQFPTALFGVFGLFMTVYILVIIGVTVTMVIAAWRAMRAHEQIAARLAEVAEALRLSKS